MYIFSDIFKNMDVTLNQKLLLAAGALVLLISTLKCLYVLHYFYNKCKKRRKKRNNKTYMLVPFYKNTGIASQKSIEYEKNDENRNMDKLKALEEGVLNNFEDSTNLKIENRSSISFLSMSNETSFSHKIELKGGFPRKLNTINIPAFSSSISQVNLMGNIWRSLTNDWSMFNFHQRCSHMDKKKGGFNCIICSTRNLSLRSVFKKKQRERMEPIEIQAHLHQFLSIEKINFNDDNLKKILNAFLSLFSQCDELFSKMVHPIIRCSQCQESNKSTSRILEIDKQNHISTDLSKIIENHLTIKNNTTNCSHSNSIEFSDDLKLLFILFQQSTEVNISNINIPNLKYKGHIEEIPNSNEDYICHFLVNDSMVCQMNGVMKKSCQPYSKHVKLIILVTDLVLEFYDYDKYLYDKIAATKFFQRMSEKNLENIEEKQKNKSKKALQNKQYFASKKGKEAQSKYFANDKGKKALAKTKSKYFDSAKGKEVHSKYFASAKGKEALAEAQSKYFASEKGKDKKQEANKTWRKNYTLRTYESDTGFQIICCYCMVWKTKYHCIKLKNSKLTEEQLEQYIHLDDGFNC